MRPGFQLHAGWSPPGYAAAWTLWIGASESLGPGDVPQCVEDPGIRMTKYRLSDSVESSQQPVLRCTGTPQLDITGTVTVFHRHTQKLELGGIT